MRPTTASHPADSPPTDAQRAGAPGHMVRVTVLYPERLNLYADRGNLTVLEQRCRRRRIGFEITAVALGERWPDASRPDLLYLGGGQDRDQRACAADLQRHGRTIARLVADGVTVLGVCGGYQLLGHEYATPDGTIPGLGLLDLTTARGDGPRLVGNAAVAVDGGRLLVGFENHQGRTTLGPGARTRPLGTVVAGHGNNGDDGTEGAIAGRVIGTYLHGPLLAKNVWFADRLLADILGVDPAALAPLDDRFAVAAHRRARAVALDGR